MVYISRFAVWTAFAFLFLGDFALGQTFSSTPDYLSFYHSKSDGKMNSVSEQSIALSWIFERFTDPAQSWETLRDYLKRHKQLYPDSEQCSLVAGHLKVVEQMLDERRPSDDMKVERMIYDLREINKRSRSQPQIILDGHVHITEGQFADSSSPSNAADELRDFGYDAIPTLIEHIHDRTLTRRVESRKFFPPHEVTVGECCRQIINEMIPSARQFSFESDPNASKEDMMNWYVQLIAEKKAERAHASGSAIRQDVKAKPSSQSP